MKAFAKIGRAFYSIALIVYGIQQFIYGDFRQVQLPAWQSHLPLLPVLAYLTGAALIFVGGAALAGKGRIPLLITGGIFLFLFLFVHIPFEIFGEENSSTHLGLWVSALKELALAGGAFIMASSYTETEQTTSGALIRFLERIIPFGGVFFSITIISFGITHFMYADFVATLVPAWMPDHLFWTYFAAVTLIASGICIILKVRQGAVALLLALMLFIWVFTVHLPLAIKNQSVMRGNDLSSMFDALAFCGTALIISVRTLYIDLWELAHD